jgi:hypothetical protein
VLESNVGWNAETCSEIVVYGISTRIIVLTEQKITILKIYNR